MFSRNSRIRLLVVALTIICGACGPSLQMEPTVPRSLAGNWKADAAQCEQIETQLHAALNQAQEKELREATKRAPKMFRPVEGEAEMRHGPYAWEVRDQNEAYQAIFDEVRPRQELRIAQSPGHFQFSSPQVADRSYEPGNSSALITTFAHLKIESGWQQDVFMVHEKDGKNDVEITQRYRLQSDGTLRFELIVSLKYMQTQQFSIVYHK